MKAQHLMTKLVITVYLIPSDFFFACFERRTRAVYTSALPFLIVQSSGNKKWRNL